MQHGNNFKIITMRILFFLLLLSGSAFGQSFTERAAIIVADSTAVIRAWVASLPQGSGISQATLNDSTAALRSALQPAGSYASATSVPVYSFLASDVVNNNAVANTIADVTGLSFAVSSGVTYRFKFFIVYTSAATTTGSRWTLNGPATTYLNYDSRYTLTATSQSVNSGASAYTIPAVSSASSLAAGNIAIIEGIIKPSASGTLIARFASEISSSAITAKAFQSYVEYQAIN